MKLSKFTKQIIAVVMSLALVFVGNWFMPNGASADVTWTDVSSSLVEGQFTAVGNYQVNMYGCDKAAYEASDNGDHIKAGRVGQNNWWAAYQVQIKRTITENAHELCTGINLIDVSKLPKDKF